MFHDCPFLRLRDWERLNRSYFSFVLVFRPAKSSRLSFSARLSMTSSASCTARRVPCALIQSWIEFDIQDLELEEKKRKKKKKKETTTNVKIKRRSSSYRPINPQDSLAFVRLFVSSTLLAANFSTYFPIFSNSWSWRTSSFSSFSVTNG